MVDIFDLYWWFLSATFQLFTNCLRVKLNYLLHKTGAHAKVLNLDLPVHLSTFVRSERSKNIISTTWRLEFQKMHRMWKCHALKHLLQICNEYCEIHHWIQTFDPYIITNVSLSNSKNVWKEVLVDSGFSWSIFWWFLTSVTCNKCRKVSVRIANRASFRKFHKKYR